MVKTGKFCNRCPISGGVNAAAFEDETGLLFVSTREGIVRKPGLHAGLGDLYWRQNQLASAEAEFQSELKAGVPPPSSIGVRLRPRKGRSLSRNVRP